MNDPLIARFSDACGATRPLNLRVGLPEGGVLAEGCVQQPFTLIGRDDACDVTLSDPGVNPRHAWFQVIAGHVFAIDLGSRAGLVWPDKSTRSDWLQPHIPVRLGPFHVQLLAPVSDRTESPGPDPMVAEPNGSRTGPLVQLEFRNGKRAKDRWTINRPVTLVGRSDACKLHLHADDISAFHCGLVLTPAGLWVVDLSGRGVVVNGERMRVAPLCHGAELWVGRFLIGCNYASQTGTPNSSRQVRTNIPVSGPPTLRIPHPPPIAEDEVPLGGLPGSDTSGLPNSHILADAFAATESNGPLSAPILVTGGGSTPPPPATPAPRATQAATIQSAPVFLGIPADSSIAPILNQLSEIHGQMLEQFHQSLLLLAKLCSRVPSADPRILQHELSRIQEVNAELAKLQSEVTRQTLAKCATDESERPTTSDPTPIPDLTPIPSRPHTMPSEAIQEWVEARIGALQKERRNRWEKLSGLLDGSS